MINTLPDSFSPEEGEKKVREARMCLAVKGIWADQSIGGDHSKVTGLTSCPYFKIWLLGNS